MRKIWIYGFDSLMYVVKSYYLVGDNITIRAIKQVAEWMREMYPAQLTIIAVDDRPNLGKEFRQAVKTNDFTIRYEFEDTIRHEGILVQ